MKEKFADWKNNVKREYGKITWPGKNRIAAETGIVIAVSTALGVFIAVVDMLMKSGIDMIITHV